MGDATRASTLARTHPPRRVPGSPTEVPLKLPSIPRLGIALSLLCILPAAAAAAPAAPAKAPAPKAAKGALTLLYGDDHVFAVVPPEGWTVDDTSGLGQRIRVVLYPKGQKWDTSPTVMYVNPLHQDPERRLTLRQMIERDVLSFRQQFPQGRVTEEKPIRTAKAKSAEVRYFSSKGGEPTEAVAYVPEDQLVMLLVLQARNPAGFRSALPAFESLVSSYQFVAGGVQTPR